MDSQDLKIITEVSQRNGISERLSIKKFESGQINRVYEINNQLVLKIEGEYEFAKGIFRHQPEITKQLFKAGAKVPKILEFGEIFGKEYLLMEKIDGQSLVYGWLTLNGSQKEKYIEQLAEQLEIFHSLKSDVYQFGISDQKPFKHEGESLKNLIDFSLINHAKLELEDQKRIHFLEQFFEQHKHAFDKKNSAVLIHKDIHFENILVKDGDLLGIIDWDWACYGAKDLELWKIVNFIHHPKNFVPQTLESAYASVQLIEIALFLQKHYSALWEGPNPKLRFQLFHLWEMINDLQNIQTGKWSPIGILFWRKVFEDFYQNDWLNNLFK